MNYALAILSLLPIFLVGDLLYLAFAHQLKFDYSADLQLVIDWALGTGFLTLVVFYLSLIHSSSAYIAALILFVLLAGVRLAMALKKRPAFRGIRSIRYSSIGLLLLLGLSTAIIWAVAARAGLGLDGTAHWGIKAKESFLHGGWRLFSQTYRSFPHPDYPLLVPTLQGWLYTFLGSVDEAAVKILFICFYFALAALFYRAVRPLYHRILAIIFTLLMLSTPLVAITALMAYADVPLMFFVFGSIYFLWRWLDAAKVEDVIFGSVFAAIALLVKRDGFIYWGVAFILLLALTYRPTLPPRLDSRLKRTLTYPLVGLLVAGSWMLFLFFGQLRISSFDLPPLTGMLERSDRLAFMAETVLGHYFLSPGEWGLLWYIFLVVTVWQRRKLRQRPILFVWLMSVIPIFITVAALMFASERTFLSHVTTASARLIMHTAPGAWFFIALTTTDLDVWFRKMIDRQKKVVEPEIGA